MKKHGIVLLAMAAAALGLAAFAACKDDQAPPPMEHTHAYGSWVVVDEPTCTEEGLRERTCSCGEKETEMIAALGHTAGEAVRENEVAATCTEKGSYEEVVCCTVCEEEVSRKTVEVAALGHTEGEAEKENEVAATCTAAGLYEEVVCCAACGEELSRKMVEVAALGHDYKGVVTDEALCLVPGEMTYTCTRCDDSYTEEIAPLRHSWGETKPGQAPTCTAAGYTSYETCTRCGYSNRDIIPAKGHTFIGNTCEICDYAFYSEGLAHADNGNTVTITGPGDCKDTLIYIPPFIDEKPMTEIGDYAFYNRNSLTEIVIPDSVTSIGSKAFFQCASLTEIVIPKSVTTIGSSAFSYCTSLEEIVILEGVTSIGGYAFQYCESLAEIDIPKSVTSIGDYAFNNCTALEEINIPEGVTSIGSFAFNGCSKLAEIAIPEGVESFGEGAFFQYDSLTEIVIPEGVKEIGNFAFHKCDELTTVYYRGSKEQWDSITIGLYNDALTEDKIKYNYPGE